MSANFNCDCASLCCSPSRSELVDEKVVDGLIVRRRRCNACKNASEFVTIERPISPQETAVLRAVRLLSDPPTRASALERSNVEARAQYLGECTSQAITSLTSGNYADVEDLLKAISCGLGEIQDTLKACRTHVEAKSRRISSR